MRIMFTALACAIALGVTASTARADLQVGDAYYVGRITDGIPPSGELAYVTFLISLDAGATDTLYGTEHYDRLQSPIPKSDLPKVLTAFKPEPEISNNKDIPVTGYAYILGKYDQDQAGSYVWYIPGQTKVTLPATLGSCGNNGCELSHYTLFTAAVPDGGVTLMLLGGVLVGLETLRRKLSV